MVLIWDFLIWMVIMCILFFVFSMKNLLVMEFMVIQRFWLFIVSVVVGFCKNKKIMIIDLYECKYVY